MAHINGMESFWSMMKRGYHGTYHGPPSTCTATRPSSRVRHNDRRLDTMSQMRRIAKRLDRKRLRYKDLIEHTGRQSMAV